MSIEPKSLLHSKSGAASIVYNLAEVPDDSYVSVEQCEIDTDSGKVTFTYKIVPRGEYPSLYLSNIRGLMETGKSRPNANERPAWSSLPLITPQP